MPKVRPLVDDQKVDYEWKKLSEKVIAEIAVSGIKKKKLAEISGVTPAAISTQLSRKRITIQTFLAWQIIKSQATGVNENL
jgi:predicted transcriptional regulator